MKAIEELKEDVKLKYIDNTSHLEVAQKTVEFCEDWFKMNADNWQKMDPEYAEKQIHLHLKELWDEAKKEKVHKGIVSGFFNSIGFMIVLTLIVNWVVDRFIYRLYK